MLSTVTQEILGNAAKDAGNAALVQVGIDVEANPGAADLVNRAALEYASTRSAELVGMQRNAAGDLVDNPDAAWAIDDSTRELLRADVATAIKEGWSNARLAEVLAENYAFSQDRAMTIARTETQRAANAGALSGYKASGVVQGKEWLTAGDDRVSEDCEENASAGTLGLDELFPSGDDAPPAHPNCRCTLTPVVMQADDDDEGDDA